MHLADKPGVDASEFMKVVNEALGKLMQLYGEDVEELTAYVMEEIEEVVEKTRKEAERVSVEAQESLKKVEAKAPEPGDPTIIIEWASPRFITWALQLASSPIQPRGNNQLNRAAVWGFIHVYLKPYGQNAPMWQPAPPRPPTLMGRPSTKRWPPRPRYPYSVSGVITFRTATPGLGLEGYI